MSEQIDITKKDLLDILRRCLHPPNVNYENEFKFKVYVKNIVRQIWNSLSNNEYKEVEYWLLSCRVGVIGMQYVYHNNRFYTTINELWDVSPQKNQINIPVLNLQSTIENIDTFKASVCYGFMSLLSRYTCLFPEKETKKLYTILYDNCVHQNRHNQLYYQLLSNYVDWFHFLLTSKDFDNIFSLLCYNLDKKETSALLKTVMTRCENYNSDIVFHIITANTSWTSKHKYLFLNEILLHDANLICQVRHEDFAIGLFYGISKFHLAPASGKLYNSVVKVINEDLWMKYYYPSIYRLLTSQESFTFCQKNLVKFYLPKTFERFPHIFRKLIEAVYSLEDAPPFALLNLAIIGKKQSLLPAYFEYDQIIEFGIEHYDQLVRSMALEVLCLTGGCASAETLHKIKKFVIMNINSADQPNREMIRKTFESFLKSLQNFILRTKSTDETVNIAEFLNWLIPFLLNNFKTHHNYQRITLSLQLIYLTSTYFSLAACTGIKQPLAEKLKNFITKHEILLSCKVEMKKFVHMLTVRTDQKGKILEMIFKNFLPYELLNADINITTLLMVAKTKISDCNMAESNIGENLFEFVVRFMQVTDDPRLETELQFVQETMQLQWLIVKTSDNENVIADHNPLHSLLSLTSTLLDYYDSNIFTTLLDLIEDIVYSLLNVFELRSMMPFQSEFCKGVAKTFANQESEYYACTVNCMWLTLKACCRLAAKITNIVKTDILMYRTLEIIFSIIRRCYHKGAQEIAGSTLTEIVTSATKTDQSMIIIDNYLSNVLDGIPKMPQINNNSTVRRAAETRVFLSALAVSDKRFNMPLFHKTMVYLVSLLSKCVLRMPKDPWSVMHCLVLHCLRPIIMDTAVEVQIVEYLGNLIVFCLQSFESSDWNVRNAALQTFSALTIRMLGQNISANEDSSQQYAVSLEEIFYRYPKVYGYMFLKLSSCLRGHQSRLNVVVPILTFIGMSYVRGNEFSNLELKYQLDSLSKCVADYIYLSKQPQVYMLAAKAFTALSGHKEVEGQIEKVIGILSSGQKFQKNGYIAILYTLRLLFEKILYNAQTAMRKDAIIESVESHLTSLLLMTSYTGDIFENVIAGLLLVRKGVTNIDFGMIYGCIMYVSTHPEITAQIPAIWIWIERHLQQVLPTGNVHGVIEIFMKLIFDKVPTSVKFICFKGLTTRVSQSEEDKYICSKMLLNTLIIYLFDNIHVPEKFLAEPCIQLILKLNISDLNYDLYLEVRDNLIDLESNDFHYKFMVVSCLATKQFSPCCPKITEFYYWCANKCTEYVNEDNLDILVLKSVIYISEYAMRYELPDLNMRALKLCYNMLQLGIEDLNYESAKIISQCFEQDLTYAYTNVLNLVNTEYLIPLLGTPFTLQFLIEIFLEQTDESSVEINVFEKKPNLSIETGIIADDILISIKTIINELTQTDLETAHMWFQNHTANKTSAYISQIHSVFEWVIIFEMSS